MAEPKLLYAGIDGLDIAFQGALPPKTLEQLEEAKMKAQKTMRAVLIELGTHGFEAHVHESGMRGGYRYRLSTGPVGAIFFLKNDPRPSEWNIFVSVRAATLAEYGYFETRDRIIRSLVAMGARPGSESVNRVDFAMDFLMPPHFALSEKQFVAHPRTKITPYYSDRQDRPDGTELSSVLQGRLVRSVTVGKMPGRQIIVYDKRIEAIEKKKPYWFEIWRVDPHDRSKRIFRVEIRAGKKHLKDTWQLSRFEDIEAAFGDVVTNALEAVRYLDDGEIESVSNITRGRLHPLWRAAQEAAQMNLFEMRAGLVPGQIKSAIREQATETYGQLILGNAVGLAVTQEIPMERIPEVLPTHIAALIDHEMKAEPEKFQKRLKRALKKLRFLD